MEMRWMLRATAVCLLALLCLSPGTVAHGGSVKPEALPGGFPTFGGVPMNVRLYDAGSFDLDGEIVKWEWNFGDQEEGKGGWHDYTATEGYAEHLYEHPGVIVAHLRVTDDEGNTDVTLLKIRMRKDGNANPVAVAGADPTQGSAPLTVSFSPEGSYDADGSIVKWEWDYGNGVFVDCTDSEGVTDHIYGAGGTHTAVLRVTDDDGASSSATVEIEVSTCRGDWWMFGREPTHKRRSPFVGSQTGTVQWSYRLGRAGHSSAVVGLDGTIYIGCNDPYLYALNPDGTLKWRAETGYNDYSSPAIGADCTIYIAGGDGLTAVNPDGTIQWRYVTEGNFQNSSPNIAADGTIYWGSYDGYVYANNPDGTLKWRFHTGGVPYYSRVESSPAIGPDGTVYIGSRENHLFAFNPDGTVKWQHHFPWFVDSSPAIGEDGTIYVGCNNGELRAINPDGTLKWSYRANSAIRCSPAIGEDGTIYVGSWDTFLHAINPDGSLQWRFATEGSINYSSASIGADGTIYVGSSDRYIYALNPDGTLKWRYLTDGIVRNSAAIAPDGTVYMGNGAGNVYAFGE